MALHLTLGWPCNTAGSSSRMKFSTAPLPSLSRGPTVSSQEVLTARIFHSERLPQDMAPAQSRCGWQSWEAVMFSLAPPWKHQSINDHSLASARSREAWWELSVPWVCSTLCHVVELLLLEEVNMLSMIISFNVCSFQQIFENTKGGVVRKQKNHGAEVKEGVTGGHHLH